MAGRYWLAELVASAERHGLTPSGLARRAGLDPTSFNKSKRLSAGGRLRWPSTESVAKVLDASMIDRADLEARLVVITALADIDHHVCRPLPIDGQLAVELTDIEVARL